MAKHTSKKLFAGLLALSAGFVLASCDPVSALPTNYTSPIVSSEYGKVDVDDNKIGTIYDAVASEKNAKVINGILREIAESKFGTYEDFLQASKGSSDDRTRFLNKYSAYFGKGKDAAKRFEHFEKDVNERISEFFYNEIKNSSYEDEEGRFDEEKFYKAKRYELYDLDNITYADEAEKLTKFARKFIDNTVEKSKAYSLLKQSAQYEKTSARGYIKEKVYPDILKNKLVEDYVYRENRNSLGRAYARQVNMVKLSYEGKDAFARDLAAVFATKYVEQNVSDVTNVDFELLVNAYKGFAPAAEGSVNLIAPLVTEDALFTSLKEHNEKISVLAADAKHYKYLDHVIVPAGNYYVKTKLGKILKEYKLAIAGENNGRYPTPEQKTALSNFTGEGKSKEYGLFKKVLALMQEDYTTDGWHVKSAGISDLPSALKDRLFNIRVANSIDDVKALVNEKYNSAHPENSTIGAEFWTHEADANGNATEKVLTRLPYLRKINGRKFVIPAKPSYNEKPQNYVYDDVTGKSVTICQVLEAPSTAKLNPDATTVYDSGTGKAELKKENLARQVSKVLGTKDSYIKDAYTEVLNKYEFAFYDSSLYDYLKSEYPDLDIFDED